jgi:hypothetical protein
MYKNNNVLGAAVIGSNIMTRNINQSFDEVLAGAANSKHKRHSSFGSQNNYQPYAQQSIGFHSNTFSKNNSNLKSKVLSPAPPIIDTT